MNRPSTTKTPLAAARLVFRPITAGAKGAVTARIAGETLAGGLRLERRRATAVVGIHDLRARRAMHNELGELAQEVREVEQEYVEAAQNAGVTGVSTSTGGQLTPALA